MADETNRERDSGTMTVDGRLDDYKMAIGNDADIMIQTGWRHHNRQRR
jgi:hypothetical protein